MAWLMSVSAVCASPSPSFRSDAAINSFACVSSGDVTALERVCDVSCDVVRCGVGGLGLLFGRVGVVSMCDVFTLICCC